MQSYTHVQPHTHTTTTHTYYNHTHILQPQTCNHIHTHTTTTHTYYNHTHILQPHTHAIIHTHILQPHTHAIIHTHTHTTTTHSCNHAHTYYNHIHVHICSFSLHCELFPTYRTWGPHYCEEEVKEQESCWTHQGQEVWHTPVVWQWWDPQPHKAHCTLWPKYFGAENHFQTTSKSGHQLLYLSTEHAINILGSRGTCPQLTLDTHNTDDSSNYSM